jgi:hypothetical protein
MPYHLHCVGITNLFEDGNVLSAYIVGYWGFVCLNPNMQPRFNICLFDGMPFLLCKGSNGYKTPTAPFTLGVRANVQPKSSIPIGAKVEISPKGFTLGVKAEIEK